MKYTGSAEEWAALDEYENDFDGVEIIYNASCNSHNWSKTGTTPATCT